MPFSEGAPPVPEQAVRGPDRRPRHADSSAGTVRKMILFNIKYIISYLYNPNIISNISNGMLLSLRRMFDLKHSQK